MGQIVAVEYLSLDGVTEDPGPMGEFAHRGWTLPYWNDELAESQSELLFGSDALLLGRVTYDEFVASWPLRSGDPFTDRINGMPRFVASTTLKGELEWNATLLEGDVVEAVRTLKRQSGNDLLIYGSSTLVNALMPHGLIDVYRLIVDPVRLGSGQPYFTGASEPTTLRLSEAKATSTGVVVLTYEATREGAES
jgi:dihydrofolate reductase